METLADVEYFNVSEINLGWVIYLRKPPPSGESLKWKWANSYCKNDCHLKEKGYDHPIAVVGVHNLQDGHIEISFVQVTPSLVSHQTSCIHNLQMTTTPFGGDLATVCSSPGDFEVKDKSRKYFFEATWLEGLPLTSMFHMYTLSLSNY